MPSPEAPPNPYWNHNVHYHRLVLGAVPDGCTRALDIGCGDGLLARKLARRIPEVTGVDRSPAMIRLAREAASRTPNAAFVEADFMTAADGVLPGHYDFLSAVAVLHHLDFTPAVRRMADLLAPGGRLVVIGLANNGTPLDWLISGAGVPAALFLARRHGGKSEPSGLPMRDPDMTWSEIRRAARDLLPGSRISRHLLWRYAWVWDKPSS